MKQRQSLRLLAVGACVVLVAASCSRASRNDEAERDSGSTSAPWLAAETLSEHSMHIRADTGGTVSLGGAKIVIPPYALSADASVSIERLAMDTPDALGDPYRFDVDGAEVVAPVGLYLPADALKLNNDAPQVLAYVGPDGWQAVAATLADDGSSVFAEVTHLSIWSAVEDLLQSVLDFVVGDLLGLFGQPPSCTKDLAGVRTETSSPGRSTPFLFCIDNRSGTVEDVRLTSNRAFPLDLTLTGPITGSEDDFGPTDLDKIFAAVSASQNALYLPSGGSLTLHWDTAGGTASIEARSDDRLVAIQIVLKLLAELYRGVNLLETARQVVNCLFVVEAGNLRELADRAGHCAAEAIGDAGDALVGGVRFASTLLKRLLLVLDLVPAIDRVLDPAAGLTSFRLRLLPPSTSTAPPQQVPPTPNGNSTSPATSSPPPVTNRRAVTSYDEMRGGAPYWGRANYGYQDFTARSNTLTYVGVTWGSGNYPAGATLSGVTTKVQVCESIGGQTDSHIDCNGMVAEKSAKVLNYGNSAVDIGDVSVTPGARYYLVYYQPAQAAGSWDVFWWSGSGNTGRSDIASSDRMQAAVKGYDR